MFRGTRPLAFLLLSSLHSLLAQEPDPVAPGPPPPPAAAWKVGAELSFVSMSGNADSTSVGAQSSLTRSVGASTVAFKVKGVRVETTTFTRTAVGTPSDFQVRERSETAVTAEHYQSSARYQRKLGDHVYGYGEGSWERNRPTGIDNRYSAAVGFGNVWHDTRRARFRTEYAATVTRQEDVIDEPAVDDTFLGARAASEWILRFGDNERSAYTNELAADGNLEETSDWRATMANSLAVTLSANLKLKVSLQWLYDNRPSFVEVELFDALGVPTGQRVLVELDELDTIFTTSLVLDF